MSKMVFYKAKRPLATLVAVLMVITLLPAMTLLVVAATPFSLKDVALVNTDDIADSAKHVSFFDKGVGVYTLTTKDAKAYGLKAESQSCAHSYYGKIYESDSAGHSRICDYCSFVDTKKKHDPFYDHIDETETHSVTCETCGYKIGEVACTYDVVDYTCVDCLNEKPAETCNHQEQSTSYKQLEGSKHEKYCDTCQGLIEPAVCDFNQYSPALRYGTHYEECICGRTASTEAKACVDEKTIVEGVTFEGKGEDGKCDLCGYVLDPIVERINLEKGWIVNSILGEGDADSILWTKGASYIDIVGRGGLFTGIMKLVNTTTESIKYLPIEKLIGVSYGDFDGIEWVLKGYPSQSAVMTLKDWEVEMILPGTGITHTTDSVTVTKYASDAIIRLRNKNTKRIRYIGITRIQ